MIALSITLQALAEKNKASVTNPLGLEVNNFTKDHLEKLLVHLQQDPNFENVQIYFIVNAKSSPEIKELVEHYNTAKGISPGNQNPDTPKHIPKI